MTLKIEIDLHPDNGPLADQMENHMLALGYERRSPSLREVAEAAHDAGFKVEIGVEPRDGPLTAEEVRNLEAATLSSHLAPAGTETPKRERGKPAPGRARRTKEEIAEDEAADKADAARSSEAFGIQSGGERVNPEEAAQDAADEAAEDAANRDAAKPLTLDDVKNAVGLYVTKFGAGDFEKGRQIASEDGPGLFVDVLGPPPAGEPFWKFSILPSEQDKIAAMVKAWTDAANSGTRYQRKGA